VSRNLIGGTRGTDLRKVRGAEKKYRSRSSKGEKKKAPGGAPKGLLFSGRLPNIEGGRRG